MKDFLFKLPSLLATFSISFLVALKKQTLELARALKSFCTFLARLVIRLAKRLWPIYCEFEQQLLGVIVDLALAFVAFRYLFLLLAIAVVFIYFNLWLIACLYILFLIMAGLRFFRRDPTIAAQQEQSHKKSHETFVRLLRWPYRALASALILYASWHFIEWRLHSSYAPIQASEHQIKQDSVGTQTAKEISPHVTANDVAEKEAGQVTLDPPRTIGADHKADEDTLSQANRGAPRQETKNNTLESGMPHDNNVDKDITLRRQVERDLKEATRQSNREKAARKEAERRVREMSAQIAIERSAREDAERKVKEADEKTTPWYTAIVENRTRGVMPFSVSGVSYSLQPHYRMIFTSKKTELTILYDRSYAEGYQEGKYTLKCNVTIGRPPSEEEKSSAPVNWFAIDIKGDIGLYVSQ